MSEILAALYQHPWVRSFWSYLYRVWSWFFWPSTAPSASKGRVFRLPARLLHHTETSAFSRYLHRHVPSVAHPTALLQGTLQEALDRAQDQKRLLLFYSHAVNDQQADLYLAEVLLNDILQDFLRDHHILFWAALASEEEEASYALGIIDPLINKECFSAPHGIFF